MIHRVKPEYVRNKKARNIFWESSVFEPQIAPSWVLGEFDLCKIIINQNFDSKDDIHWFASHDADLCHRNFVIIFKIGWNEVFQFNGQFLNGFQWQFVSAWIVSSWSTVRHISEFVYLDFELYHKMVCYKRGKVTFVQGDSTTESSESMS